MKLLTVDDATAGHPRMYRVSVTAQWIIVPVLGGIVGWLGWLVVLGTPGWQWSDMLLGWCAAWLALFGALMANDLRKALKSTAWLAATDDGGLYIKLRSYQNIGWGSGGLQVLFLPWREIRCARLLDRTWVTPSSRTRSRRERQRYVEFDVSPRLDLAELRTILANDRDGRPDGIKRKARWGHFPVSVERERTIRVEWRARPSIKHFMAEVAAWVNIDTPEKGIVNATATDVGDSALEELARRGDLMGLIRALRVRDDLSLVEAKERAQAMIAGTDGRAVGS